MAGGLGLFGTELGGRTRGRELKPVVSRRGGALAPLPTAAAPSLLILLHGLAQGFLESKTSLES